MIYSIFNHLIITIVPFLPYSLIKMISRRYVAGESDSDVLKIVKELNNKGYAVTLDILGEHSETKTDAYYITNKYAKLSHYLIHKHIKTI